MTDKSPRFAWIDRLPEFGQSHTITSLIDEIESIPEQIEELQNRKHNAELELTKIIKAFWTEDEISVAKEGRYA